MIIKHSENLEKLPVLPALSVVLPVFNGQRYLAEAIDSILEQTFIDFELIMIDDGSSDDSLRIMEAYEQLDSRVRVITRENRGLPTTLNEAIDISRGKWIARMDHDDICHANRFLLQTEFMRLNPTTVILGSAAGLMEKDGNLICTYVISTGDKELRMVFPRSPFIHPAVMFSKSAFYEAGKYNEKMKWGGEDITLFERMSRIGKLHNLSQPLINYRLVPGSMSRKPPIFRNMLTKIIVDEIAGKKASYEQFASLKQEIKKIDKSNSIFDYHFEVAKLYLWSGGVRSKTFKHLSKCNSLNPYSLKVFFMYFIAIMPCKLTVAVFLKLKGRLYIRGTK